MRCLVFFLILASVVSVLQLKALFSSNVLALTAVFDGIGLVRLLYCEDSMMMAPQRWMMVAIALVFGSGCVPNESFDCHLLSLKRQIIQQIY